MMDDWFSVIAAGCELSPLAIQELGDSGFVVIPGPVPPEGPAHLAEAYDSAVAGADLNDVRVGSTTTRIHDFVNRGAEFDRLYVHRPVLEACVLRYWSAVQAQFNVRENSATAHACTGPACGLPGGCRGVDQCWVSSSWWMSSEVITGPPVSFRVRTGGPQLQAA